MSLGGRVVLGQAIGRPPGTVSAGGGTVVHGYVVPTQNVGHEVIVPDGAVQGGVFLANTPDGQQIEVTVPEGVEPGHLVSFNYCPMPAVHPIAIGAPMLQAPGQILINQHLGMSRWEMHEIRRLQAIEHDLETMHDQEAGANAWTMYLCGWVVCCFCGPAGPIVWLIVWCSVYRKTAEERRGHVEEQIVARASLATACCTMSVGGLMMLAIYLKNGTLPLALR